MNCPKCGKPLEDGQLVCPSCGAAIDEALDGAAEKAKQMAGDAVDATKSAGETAKEAAGDVSDAVKGAGETAKETAAMAAGAAENAGETAKEAAGDVSDAVKGAGETAKETAAMAAGAVENAGETAKEAAGDASDAVKDAGEAAKGAAADKAEDVSKSVKSAMDSAKERVEQQSVVDKPAKKDSKTGMIVAIVLGVAVLCGVVWLIIHFATQGQGKPAASTAESVVTSVASAEEAGSTTGSTAETTAGTTGTIGTGKAEDVIMTFKNTDLEITNEQLSYYYWGEYYYAASYGEYMTYYGYDFDATKPLNEQDYAGNEDITDQDGDGKVTWQDYFLNSAFNTIGQTVALVAEAKSSNFELAGDSLANYQSTLDSFDSYAVQAGFTDDDGNADLLAYIQDSYGTVATVEGFESYLQDSYLASAYSDEIYNSSTYTDEQIEKQYDDNADTYQANGIEKLDTPDVNVRHILISTETTNDAANAGSAVEEAASAQETGSAAEEATNAEAKAKAEDILAEWKAGAATEDSFAELANENTDDTGSSTNGGLYEDVYPGQMVEAFNDWCFNQEHKPGDTGIVETDYGYHIMYFVGYTDKYYWRTSAESDLRYESYNTTMTSLMDKYAYTVSNDKVIVSVPDSLYNAAADAASNVEDIAASTAVADAGSTMEEASVAS